MHFNGIKLNITGCVFYVASEERWNQMHFTQLLKSSVQLKNSTCSSPSMDEYMLRGSWHVDENVSLQLAWKKLQLSHESLHKAVYFTWKQPFALQCLVHSFMRSHHQKMQNQPFNLHSRALGYLYVSSYKTLESQLSGPKLPKYFDQAEPSDSCVVKMSPCSVSQSSKSATNCLWFGALVPMKLTISWTTSLTWSIDLHTTDLHKTSWCKIQCKNTRFCSGFISATLSRILYKNSNIFLCQIWTTISCNNDQFVPSQSQLVQTYIYLCDKGCLAFLFLSLTALPPAPVWSWGCSLSVQKCVILPYQLSSSAKEKNSKLSCFFL